MQRFADVIKFLSVLLLLALPPWFSLVKRIRNRKKRRFLWTFVFIPYIISTTYTQNVLPFFAVLITLYFIKNQRDEEELFYLRSIKGQILYLIVLNIIFRLVVTLLSGIYANILIKLGFKLQMQDVMKLFIEKPWKEVIYLSIMTIVFAPILEEFIFRHILYRYFSKVNKMFSAILTSFLFMLLHYNLAGSLSFFMFGLFNCYLYDKFGYKAAVFNHFLFNFTSVVLILIFKYYNIPITT